MTQPVPFAHEHETERDRLHRLAREADGIAEACASARAGRLVEEADVDAWIDSIGTDDERPVPCSSR